MERRWLDCNTLGRGSCPRPPDGTVDVDSGPWGPRPGTQGGRKVWRGAYTGERARSPMIPSVLLVDPSGSLVLFSRLLLVLLPCYVHCLCPLVLVVVLLAVLIVVLLVALIRVLLVILLVVLLVVLPVPLVLVLLLVVPVPIVPPVLLVPLVPSTAKHCQQASERSGSGRIEFSPKRTTFLM